MRLSVDLDQEQSRKWLSLTPGWGVGVKILRYLIEAAVYKQEHKRETVEVPTLETMARNTYKFKPGDKEHDEEI